MAISMISIPDIHTFCWLCGDLKYIPRAVCRYKITKNKDAPFICKTRVAHPKFMSRIIITITLKAFSICAVYIIDRINPVNTCSIRVIPRRNPIFHKNEMDNGVGRSTSDFFIMWAIGLFFIS